MTTSFLDRYNEKLTNNFSKDNFPVTELKYGKAELKEDGSIIIVNKDGDKILLTKDDQDSLNAMIEGNLQLGS